MISISGLLKSIPGILLCVVLAYLSVIISKFFGENILKIPKSPISPIIICIIFGIIVANFIKIPEKFLHGISFSGKNILRIGIALLGIRISLPYILELSYSIIPIIIVSISLSLAFCYFLSRLVGISPKMGTLIAVGTSICGASAIVATSPVIDAKKEEVTYAVANITIFGIIAMIIYPFICYYIFERDITAVGIFLGTAIHETGQVAGAGIIYSEQFASPEAMEVATVTKLVRNISMIIVIPLMGIIYFKGEKNKTFERVPGFTSLIPLFIFGFIAMGALRTVGDLSIQHYGSAFLIMTETVWGKTIEFFRIFSDYSLATAMAGIGLMTNLKSLQALGIKPFYVGFLSAIFMSIVSYLSIRIII